MSEASLSALFLQNPQLAIALRRQMEAQGQIKEGTSSEPVRSPWQGLNRVANALLGGYEYRKADEEMKAGSEAANREVADFGGMVAQALQGQRGPAAAPAMPPAAATEGAPPPMDGAAAPPSANAQEFVRRFAPQAMAASRATGLDPRLILAQGALESAWGSKAPGNNLFGIKGPGQVLNTQESVNGQMVPQQASFRSYGSPDESFQDYAAFIKGNPRYAPVMSAQGLDAQIDAMGRSGYATDPNYAQKLRMLARGIQLPEDGGVPRETPPAAAMPQPGQLPMQPPGAQAGMAPPGAPAPQAPAMAPPGIPTRPGGQNTALMDIYIRGISSNNPRVRAIAQGLAPFMKQEDEARVLAPGAMLMDRQGRVLAQNPNDPTMNRISLNNDMRGPTAFEQDRGKALAERVGEWDASWEKSQQTMGNITAFRRAMADVQTGIGSGAQITLGQVGQRLGIPEVALSAIGLDPKKVADLETIRSMSSKFLLDQLGKGGFPAQNFSNADREMLERALPGLANTPQGNEMIMSIMEAGARRQSEIGRAWREFAGANGEDINAARRFQREALPKLVERDVITPIFNDMKSQQASPDAAGTAAPAAQPRIRTWNPATGRLE